LPLPTSYTGKNVLADAGLHQLRQLGDIGCNAPRFILGELLESSTSGLFIRKIDIRQCSAIGVADVMAHSSPRGVACCYTGSITTSINWVPPLDHDAKAAIGPSRQVEHVLHGITVYTVWAATIQQHRQLGDVGRNAPRPWH
jgi:hypothetical protein